MSRSTAFAIAVFVAAGCLSGGRTAHARAAGGRLPRAKAAPDVVRCRSCSFPCPKGTVNCWACGTRVPGPKTAKDLAPVKFIKMSFAKPGKSRLENMAVLSPHARFEAIEEWIADNPGEFKEAISRFTDLLGDVRGTALEITVTTRIERLKLAKAEADRPKTPEEREAEAARAVVAYMREVRGSKNVLKNVKKLKALFKIAQGTSYQGYVERQLEREMDKQR